MADTQTHLDLHHLTFVITGATGGIGRALASALAKEHANLILIARRALTLRAQARQLQLLGSPNVAYYTCDLGNPRPLHQLLRRLQSHSVDCLINCAGIGIYKPFPDVTTPAWQASFNLNVTAPYFLAQGLIPQLSASSLALVLNIGSGAGVIPMRSRSVYCGTKFALRGWTLSLAEEYHQRKPHFCLITLGSTLTSFGPLTLSDKQKEQQAGKAYFTPDFVAAQLLAIIQDGNRQVEYTLYPGDYGLGAWQKP